MPGKFAIETIFSAKDRITKTFGRMGKAADKFGFRSDKAFRRASKSASKFRSVTSSIIKAQVITRGFAAISQGIGSVLRQFADFDTAITGATARFKDIGPAAADFNQQMKILRSVARDAGATTEFTAAQAAEALNFLAKAGFSSVEAIGSLRSMINLATASGEDFAMVADFSSDLLGAFGLNVDNAAQKIKNLTRLNDVLVKAANTANVTIETQFETMKGVAPVAVDLGISLEELAAATALLGGAGIKGTLATTALRNAFLNLSTQPKKVVKSLKSINVEIDDGTGNMKKFSTIMNEIAEQTKDLGNLGRAKIFESLFGKRAIAGASNILKGVDAMNAFEKSLLDAAGTSELTAERLRQSLGNRLLTLASSATEFGFKIFDAFEIRGKKGIDGLTEAFRAFDPKPLISGIEATIKIGKGLFTIFKPLIPVIGLVSDILVSIANIITGLESKTGFFEAAFKGFERFRGFVGETLGINKTVSPPNKAEAEARRQIGFEGRINIAGAPPGSTVSSKTTGAPEIDMTLLGAN